jgi:hypothetical protein
MLKQEMTELKDNGITDEDDLYNSLMDYASLAQQSPLDKDVLDTLVKGIMYQCHPTETIRRRVQVDDDNGGSVSKMYELTLIVGAGTQSSADPSTTTKE